MNFSGLMGHGSAVITYFILTITVGVLGLLSQKVVITLDGSCKMKVRRLPYFLATAILVCFAAAYASGADYAQYIEIYMASTWSSLADPQIEFGYRIINIALKAIFPNAEVGVAVIKALSVLLTCIAIYKLRTRINLGISLFSYVALSYLISLNLIRIYFAASIILFGIAFLYMAKKHNIAKLVISILLATTVHYTAISVIVLPIILILKKHIPSQDRNKNKVILILIVIFVIAALYIIPVLVENISILNKYLPYMNASGSIGIGQIVFFTVPLYWLIICRKKSDRCGWNIAYIIILLSFAIGLLGYRIGMLSRLSAFFNMTFIIVMPQLIMDYQKYVALYRGRYGNNVQILILLTIVYILLRLIVYLGSMTVDGIQEIIFVWDVTVQ